MGKVISKDNTNDLKEDIRQQYNALLIESEDITSNYLKGSTDMNQLSSQYYKQSTDQAISSLFINENSTSKEIEATENQSLKTLLQTFDNRWAQHLLNLLKEKRKSLENQPKSRKASYNFKYLQGKDNDYVLFKFYVSSGGLPEGKIVLYCCSIERFDKDGLPNTISMTLQAVTKREILALSPANYSAKQSGLLSQVLKKRKPLSTEELMKKAIQQKILIPLFPK